MSSENVFSEFEPDEGEEMPRSLIKDLGDFLDHYKGLGKVEGGSQFHQLLGLASRAQKILIVVEGQREVLESKCQESREARTVEEAKAFGDDYQKACVRYTQDVLRELKNAEV